MAGQPGSQSSNIRGATSQPQQQQQAPSPFAGRGVAIGGVDQNNRDAQPAGFLARLNKPKKNYNQLDGQDDDDNGDEDDIESQTTDNQSRA
eukprot:CAMPEP_0176406210 /NCGR_PEP_ID=MMETSP0127-20121128/750_1 /TAXON_ID=938130 /ORGANISM="Platyophrya macrostoma, Strain WH" /LENGTH=90 /DNA_ID=CAMNT_0017785321 /DNA_START=731 /DNA_END=1003 /DNA_ORIENTATION=+